MKIHIMKICMAMLCLSLLISALPCVSLAGDAPTSPEDIITVVIDAGHGGNDPGTCENGIIEKETNLKIATELFSILSEAPRFNVYMTRLSDTGAELYERAIFANEVNADLLISIHIDSSNSDTASGATAYTSVVPDCAMTGLGEMLTASVCKATGIDNNGVIRRYDNAGYYWDYEKRWDIQDENLDDLSDYYGIPTWCAKFGIPSIILEHGFASNAHDSEILSTDEGVKSVAKADADAIISYYTGHTHTYDKPSVDYPSNCMFCGKESERCVICRHRKNIKSLESAPDAHFFETSTLREATCTECGYAEKVCRIEKSLADKGYNIVPYSESEALPPVSHVFTLKECAPPSGNIDGYCLLICENCGKTSRETVRTDTHEYMNTVSATDATCTEDGKVTKECALCGMKEETVIPAKGHVMQPSYLFGATCTSSGAMISVCSECGIQSRDEIKKAGHKTKEETILAATLFSSGQLRRYCTAGCGTEELIKTKPLIFSTGVMIGAVCIAVIVAIAVVLIIMKKKGQKPGPPGDEVPLTAVAR